MFRSIRRALVALVALTLMPLVFAPAASGDTTYIDVQPTDDLRSAIERAPAGATVRLHQGTYPALWLGAIAPALPVTVTSAAGEEAVIAGATLSGTANVVLRRLTFSAELKLRKARDLVVADSLIRQGLSVKEGTSRLAITDNRIVGGGNGIWMRSFPTTPQEYITISGNEITGQTGDAISIGVGNHVVIEDNYIHDTLATSEHNDGVQVSAGTDVVIRCNRFRGHDQSIMLKGETSYGAAGFVTDVHVENNLITANRGAGLIAAGTTNVRVVNNTFADNGGADVHMEAANPQLRIWNNVAPKQYRLGGALAPAYEDYNCTTNGGSGTNNITSDPAFVDRIDYRLSTASPCRATASAVNAPLDDLSGGVRSAPLDIGAWQDSVPVEASAPLPSGSSLESALRTAVSGQVITLSNGAFPAVALSNLSWDSPVIVRPEEGATATVPSLLLTSVANLRFEGVTFTGAVAIRGGRNVSVVGGSASSITVRDASSDVMVTANRIVGGTQGIVVSGGSIRVAVSDNVIEEPYVDGVQVLAASQVTVMGNWVKNAINRTAFQAGIRIEGGADITIGRNRVTGFDQSMTVTARSGVAAQRVRIENNLATASRGAGMLLAYVSGVDVINNTAVDNTAADLHFATGNSGARVYNNILNKIYVAGGANRAAEEDYNRVVWGGTGIHNVSVDPAFVDRVDYRLTATSPCTGTGLASVAPATDIAGTTRTSPTDMGAWEM